MEECQDYLLRSLYDTDDVSEDIRSASIAQHISIGAAKSGVSEIELFCVRDTGSLQHAQTSCTLQPDELVLAISCQCVLLVS